MKDVTLTFLLHHDIGNNHTDHDKSSDDTANDANKVLAYRKERSPLVASVTALNAHMTHMHTHAHVTHMHT